MRVKASEILEKVHTIERGPCFTCGATDSQTVSSCSNSWHLSLEWKLAHQLANKQNELDDSLATIKKMTNFITIIATYLQNNETRLDEAYKSYRKNRIDTHELSGSIHENNKVINFVSNHLYYAFPSLYSLFWPKNKEKS